MEKNLFQTLYSKFRNLILYGIIGSCTATLDFLIFTALTQGLNLYYIVANIISCSTGILCSFLLNRKYNFKVTDHIARRLLIFVAVGLTGMLLSSLILRITIEQLQWNELLSKLISIIIVVLFQFLLNKHISFRQSANTDENDK
jgi:putative flippase GtrA